MGETKKEDITIEMMSDKLKSGVVSFRFEKADGTIREALGTLHPNMLPDKLDSLKTQSLNLLRQMSSGVTPMSKVAEEAESINNAVRDIETAQGRTKKEGVVPFFDLQKNSFRSFAFDKLKEIRFVWSVE